MDTGTTSLAGTGLSWGQQEFSIRSFHEFNYTSSELMWLSEKWSSWSWYYSLLQGLLCEFWVLLLKYLFLQLLESSDMCSMTVFKAKLPKNALLEQGILTSVCWSLKCCWTRNAELRTTRVHSEVKDIYILQPHVPEEEGHRVLPHMERTPWTDTGGEMSRCWTGGIKATAHVHGASPGCTQKVPGSAPFPGHRRAGGMWSIGGIKCWLGNQRLKCGNATLQMGFHCAARKFSSGIGSPSW